MIYKFVNIFWQSDELSLSVSNRKDTFIKPSTEIASTIHVHRELLLQNKSNHHYLITSMKVFVKNIF